MVEQGLRIGQILAVTFTDAATQELRKRIRERLQLTLELIDAPVAAVWRAWSEHGEEWLCPRPWRAEIVTQELRPGGRSEMVFRGPDGEEQPLSGIYLEVVPERLVVATDAVTADAEEEAR